MPWFKSLLISWSYVWILISCLQFLKRLAVMEAHYLCIWCLISSHVVWFVWTCWRQSQKGFTPVLCVESHYLEVGSGRRFGKNSSTFQNLDSFYTSVKQCFFFNFLILQKWKSFHMLTQFLEYSSNFLASFPPFFQSFLQNFQNVDIPNCLDDCEQCYQCFFLQFCGGHEVVIICRMI